MTIAKPHPITLPQNLNFLVDSRKCWRIKTRTTQKTFPDQKSKNSKNGIPLSTPLKSDSILFSRFNSYFKIRDVQIGGLASVSSVQLPAVTNSDCHLRSCGHRLRFSGSSLLPLRRSRSSSLWIRMMSQTTDPPESTKTVRCEIKGRVQGVFYRKWTMENATQLGLKGWVRNRRDGSVEALFSGKPDSVDEMQERCRRGPPDAMVTGFQAFPCSDDPGTRFQLKPTV